MELIETSWRTITRKLHHRVEKPPLACAVAEHAKDSTMNFIEDWCEPLRETLHRTVLFLNMEVLLT